MVLRRTLLAAAGSERLRALVAGTGPARRLVGRFVAGEDIGDALEAARRLAADDLSTSIDHLGEATAHPAQAESATRAYLALLDRIGDAGLARRAEVSVKPTAVGLGLGPEGEALAAANIGRVCEAAAAHGTTVTVDMEDAAAVPATLRIVAGLRAEHPDLGCVLQSYLRRTADDLAAMAGAGARIRLCKGAYAPDPATAYTAHRDVDSAYVRHLRFLMASDAYPMVATHDPRLIAIAGMLAERAGRGPDAFEYQMLYGVRPDEQRRLAATGARVRVYVPYGQEWYGYLARRLAERPANVSFAARAVVTRS
ncbi:proline dehydrogenase family protein [Nocardiopsis sediminis]|uniref:proline dehydrogenase n=1 Tax=Nocardiopsis sediminis TaxID=1778267 RepID=A0ABV8FGX0_9ACTN